LRDGWDWRIIPHSYSDGAVAIPLNRSTMMEALEVISGWSENGVPHAMMSDGSVWFYTIATAGSKVWVRDTKPLPDAAFRPQPTGAAK